MRSILRLINSAPNARELGRRGLHRSSLVLCEGNRNETEPMASQSNKNTNSSSNQRNVPAKKTGLDADLDKAAQDVASSMKGMEQKVIEDLRAQLSKLKMPNQASSEQAFMTSLKDQKQQASDAKKNINVTEEAIKETEEGSKLSKQHDEKMKKRMDSMLDRFKPVDKRTTKLGTKQTASQADNKQKSNTKTQISPEEGKVGSVQESTSMSLGRDTTGNQTSARKHTEQPTKQATTRTDTSATTQKQTKDKIQTQNQPPSGKRKGLTNERGNQGKQAASSKESSTSENIQPPNPAMSGTQTPPSQRGPPFKQGDNAKKQPPRNPNARKDLDHADSKQEQEIGITNVTEREMIESVIPGTDKKTSHIDKEAPVTREDMGDKSQKFKANLDTIGQADEPSVAVKKGKQQIDRHNKKKQQKTESVEEMSFSEIFDDIEREKVRAAPAQVVTDQRESSASVQRDTGHVAASDEMRRDVDTDRRDAPDDRPSRQLYSPLMNQLQGKPAPRKKAPREKDAVDQYIDDNSPLGGFKRKAPHLRGRDWMKQDSLGIDVSNGLLAKVQPLGIFNVEKWHSEAETIPLSQAWVEEEASKLTDPVFFINNGFEEMIQWTQEGKLWQYPIDNEQGMDTEKHVPFYEHVFLDKHLKPFPREGPVRRFMELVVLGLDKNPYLSVDEKVGHINWFADYFKKKQPLIQGEQLLHDSAV